MATDEFTIEDEPRPDDREYLNDQLYRFNARVTGIDNGRWLAIFARDTAGTIVAGLHGWTWGVVGHVDTLWVREDLRGQGLGKRLLAAAEREAARRGCEEMQLATHSYQAPEFYPRAGYQQIGELPSWPRPDHTRYFFRKSLASGNAESG